MSYEVPDRSVPRNEDKSQASLGENTMKLESKFETKIVKHTHDIQKL